MAILWQILITINPYQGNKNPKKSKKVTNDQHETLLETAIEYLKRPKQVTQSQPPPQFQPQPNIAKSSGALFGEMVAQIYEEIPNGFSKDMLKIDVMK